MSEPKVVFEPVPSRWRVENRIRDGKWVGDQCFPTLEAATAYAQKWLDNNPDGYAYRVVDTQPDEAQPDAVRVGDETPLTLDQYQEQAKATAVYPEDKAREYLVAGLAGEVGEVASLFAKHWRADQEWLDYSEVAAELGDVLWFITLLADEVGYDLSEVAQNNLDKLADRAERGKLKGNGDNR